MRVGVGEGLELENCGAPGHVRTWEDRRLAASQLSASSFPRSDSDCLVELAREGTQRMGAWGREFPKNGVGGGGDQKNQAPGEGDPRGGAGRGRKSPGTGVGGAARELGR